MIFFMTVKQLEEFFAGDVATSLPTFLPEIISAATGKILTSLRKFYYFEEGCRLEKFGCRISVFVSLEQPIKYSRGLVC